ncbi:unnamed protein product [Rotaria socialis]|uniref:C2HC/C3H-type domain-containing protein n=1 Tax=Rotaria socialis TaxID=392032 RepID=A0A820YU21_9BILA|nr:unnamed protein product [Rotaria socialis]CAF3534711.1 unnamed protein product [Rotaria socialis]CAF3636131.1 unnamed protein product [Rotaria socialis]CAF3715040.1 unnamed protein product [Rotaria socialis]CAF3740882.1 unnamed protein product [Rotaria socialis]
MPCDVAEANSDMYGTEKHNLVEGSYQITENQSIPVYADIQTYPCSNCNRCFNAESLRKHQPICKKTSQKVPRKIFDTGKQRANDSDVPYVATKETTQFYKEGIKPKADYKKNKTSNWREEHNELVRTIREARQVTQTTGNSAPQAKSTSSQAPTDYIQCEYCQRHFNQYSAERHIPFCETQFKRKQMQYTSSTTNNTRTPAGSIGRQGRLNQQQLQTNSAPSTLVSQHTQKTNGEKDYRRTPLNSNTFKRITFNEITRKPMNGKSPKFSSDQVTKTRSAAGNYLPGMMRTGRTIKNNDLNLIAAVGRERQKKDVSPRLQQRTIVMKKRSPSPTHRLSQLNGSFNYQQKKIRAPIASTAPKNCHECGESFPVEWAKFCCECGEKRAGFE